jgi:hypothetical protein
VRAGQGLPRRSARHTDHDLQPRSKGSNYMIEVSTVTGDGHIPLKRQKKAVLDDRRPAPATGRRRGSELLARLRIGQCELCGQRAQVQVHQVPKLAHLTTPGRPQPPWMQQMARMRRKTLIVCPPCHDRVHNRQPANTLT